MAIYEMGVRVGKIDKPKPPGKDINFHKMERTVHERKFPEFKRIGSSGHKHIKIIQRKGYSRYSVTIVRGNRTVFWRLFETLEEAIEKRDKALKSLPQKATVKSKSKFYKVLGVTSRKCPSGKIVWLAYTSDQKYLYYGHSFEEAVSARKKWEKENNRLCVDGYKQTYPPDDPEKGRYHLISNLKKGKPGAGYKLFRVSVNGKAEPFLTCKLLKVLLIARDLYWKGFDKYKIRRLLRPDPDRGIRKISYGKWELSRCGEVIAVAPTRSALVKKRDAWEKRFQIYIDFEYRGFSYRFNNEKEAE